MYELMSARSLTTRPVVTLGGDVVAHVRDTVFDASAGRITGFTLSGPHLLSGPLRLGLPWPAVHALGHDAVMIRDAGAPAPVDMAAARQAARRGRVVGARVLTDAGTEVGTVLDVVVEGGKSGRVTGFRIAARKALVPGPKHHRRRVYVPRGETLAVSGGALVIPGDTTHYVVDDLPAFVHEVGALRESRKGALP
ncbi:PRC-barrel domain-containing protein [Streptomyces sp. TRM68367]|uniref:PRC-barrel domain-containing protein n=1 Tax=Streptomyces sp. TRM68367 TaxID=2758415 RepID=UPI00165A78D4|nr:PRC-barrel domain-containing protein [Streptomyces sp. TRM68367]MBC9727928.1 PRC-barrel domain-containing protein [Streptomyces sp. TRM68367]